jgi:NitT/TauT family transport system permease protein
MSASTLRGVASVIGAFVLWELIARYVVANPLFLASFSAVIVRAIELWKSGELQNHIWVSFVEFAGGFLLASIVGISLGIVMAGSRIVRELFDPWMSMLYSTPILALGPLFILWLGIGVGSKIAIIFLVAVFPILINTLTGLSNTDQTLIEVARSLGASPAQIYAKVRLPSALPYIIAGLRLSVARALVGVVVAELFGSRAGLGFLVLNAAQTFDTAAVFVGVAVLSIAGILSVEFLKWAEARLAPWRFPENEG